MNIGKLSEYCVTPDSDWDVEYMIRESNVSNVIELLDKLLDRLDCSKVYPSGLRVMQTIDYPYKREITRFLFVLSTVDEDTRNVYMDKLFSRHEQNLNYESTNAPVWYDEKYKKARRSTTKRVTEGTKSSSAKLTKEQKANLSLKEKIKSMGITKLNLSIKVNKK